ncbi:hypothetical protein TB2_043086 [Malus domestica]|uniref:Complex 1 LYR protein domain-containing protein n=1 Tax=Malus domestica TaxID=3750 RepID=A0A498J9V6_MALDO|nr:hypothetical protein DVH24_020638 [Malus domestica]
MVVAAQASSRAEVLTMFCTFLRVARKFTDYNIRDYTKCQTVDNFHQNRNLSDMSAISSAFSNGKAQLEVANRQALVYYLYASKLKSVMKVQNLIKH